MDKVTNKRIAAFKTGDIYKGAVAFVVLQVIMVAAVVWKPEIILYGLGEVQVLDVENVDLNITPMDEEEEAPPSFGPSGSGPGN
jgi:GntP family gluconate:H+ symporter